MNMLFDSKFPVIRLYYKISRIKYISDIKKIVLNMEYYKYSASTNTVCIYNNNNNTQLFQNTISIFYIK